MATAIILGKTIAYARVSSQDQKHDLDRKVRF